MSSSPAKTEPEGETLSAAEFAEIIVGSRREAMALSVDQIQKLAGCILVIDHQLGVANRMMAEMMVAEASPPSSGEPPSEPVTKTEIVHVPLVTGGDPALSAALESLAKAKHRLEQERHTPGENLARQNFEKVAFAICNFVSPKQRK